MIFDKDSGLLTRNLHMKNDAYFLLYHFNDISTKKARFGQTKTFVLTTYKTYNLVVPRDKKNG